MGMRPGWGGRGRGGSLPKKAGWETGPLPAWLRPPSIPQVSFQHEVYPAEPAPGPAAPGQELEERPLSRQVFIVQELEVRDRLASSQINKFLYLHTSERMPRRAHSNMVPAAPASSWPGPRIHAHPSVHAHAHTGLFGRQLGLRVGSAVETVCTDARPTAPGVVAGSRGPAGTQSLPSAPSSPSKRCTWPPQPIWVGPSAVSVSR